MRRASGVALLAVAAAIAGGCGEDEPDDPAAATQPGPLPTVEPAEEYPDALIEGVLEIRDGCLVINTTDGPVLTAWPSSSRLEDSDPAAVNVGGTVLPLDGVTRSFGGGYIGGPEAGIAEPADVLEDCASNLGVTDVWLMSGHAG